MWSDTQILRSLSNDIVCGREHNGWQKLGGSGNLGSPLPYFLVWPWLTHFKLTSVMVAVNNASHPLLPCASQPATGLNTSHTIPYSHPQWDDSCWFFWFYSWNMRVCKMKRLRGSPYLWSPKLELELRCSWVCCALQPWIGWWNRCEYGGSVHIQRSFRSLWTKWYHGLTPAWNAHIVWTESHLCFSPSVLQMRACKVTSGGSTT